MSLQVDKKTIKKVDLNNKRETVISLKFYRDENGLTVYAKSKKIHTYFSNMSDGIEDEYSDWQDIRRFALTNMALDKLGYLRYPLELWGTRMVDPNQTVNASWLLASKLDQGITVKFTSIPVSMDEYNNYTKSVISYIEKLYAQFMKPINSRGRVTSSLTTGE